MKDLSIFYAAFNVNSANEMLQKLQSGMWTDDEQELLEDVLLDHDMSVHELRQCLYNEIITCN